MRNKNVLAPSNGLIHNFEIYVGKDTLPPSNHELDIRKWRCHHATNRMCPKA